MPSVNTTVAPDITGVVNREFFIEALGGPQNPQTFLDQFPEALFTHDINSNLVAFLYALLGPAGTGAVRKDYLLARLLVENAGLTVVDLDNLYAFPFGFARLIEESYEFIPQGLLTTAEWEQIHKADASYRNRAIDFLKAVRAGGTRTGLTLAAKSGLNHPAELVENYTILFDHFSDKSLELPYEGATQSTEEVIVIPRQDIPKSSRQVLTIFGEPIEGGFTIQLPIGATANTTTATIPFNAISVEVQSALEALTVVGPGNVVVTGGPAPSIPITIFFTGDLANQPLPDLIATPNSEMLNIESEQATIFTESTQAGTAADGEDSAISAQSWYYANLAMEEIKPMTTILTPAKGAGITRRQVANLTHSDPKGTFTQVVRYVTGVSSINWPPTDNTHWIKGGRETEAPLAKAGEQQHYVSFHNISKATASSEHIGPFSRHEQILFPFLEDNPEGFRCEPDFAVVNPPEPLTVQDQAENTPLIKSIYPVDYQGLAPQTKPDRIHYWASAEQPEGSDYLEVDLGSVQATNQIILQVANKPLDLALEFDLLDNGLSHEYIPVTLNDESPSTTGVGYSVSANPWQTCQFKFANSLGDIVFARFLRIKFTRRLGGLNPFTNPNGEALPYSVVVRNLRVGRSLA